jgi:hypothetical protein
MYKNSHPLFTVIKTGYIKERRENRIQTDEKPNLLLCRGANVRIGVGSM